jgi:hypothetical protein
LNENISLSTSTEKGADLGSEGTDRDGNRKARGDVSSREGLVRNLTSNKPRKSETNKN